MTCQPQIWSVSIWKCWIFLKAKILLIFPAILTSIYLFLFCAACWSFKFYCQLGIKGHSIGIWQDGNSIFHQHCGIFWSDQPSDRSSDSINQNRLTELALISLRQCIVIGIIMLLFQAVVDLTDLHNVKLELITSCNKNVGSKQ